MAQACGGGVTKAFPWGKGDRRPLGRGWMRDASLHLLFPKPGKDNPFVIRSIRIVCHLPGGISLSEIPRHRGGCVQRAIKAFPLAGKGDREERAVDEGDAERLWPPEGLFKKHLSPNPRLFIDKSIYTFIIESVIFLPAAPPGRRSSHEKAYCILPRSPVRFRLVRQHIRRNGNGTNARRLFRYLWRRPHLDFGNGNRRVGN